MIQKIRKWLMVSLIFLLAYYAGDFLIQNNIKEVEDLNQNEQIAQYIEQLDQELQVENKKNTNKSFLNSFLEFIGISKQPSSYAEEYSPELYKDALRIFENAKLYNYENGWDYDRCPYIDKNTGFQKTSQDTRINIDCGIVINETWNYDAFMRVKDWSYNETRDRLSKYDSGYEVFTDCSCSELRKVFNFIVEKMRKKVEHECKELDLNDNQIGALTTTKYLYGNIGNFVEAYKLYGDTEALREQFYILDGNVFYFPFSTKKNVAKYSGRSEETWQIFHYGNYNLNGYHVEGGRIVLN